MDVKFILNKIKMEQNIYSDIELAELLKVSPSAVSNWKARRSMPISTIHKYCKENNYLVDDYIENNPSLLKSYSNDKIKIKNKKIDLKEGGKKVDIDTHYLIELQKDKIKQQEKEIAMYKGYVETQPVQKKQWDDIDADMRSEVLVRNVFSLRSMERKMTIDKSGAKLEKLLGLPKGHNYFDDTRWYSMDAHPIDKIIDKDSLKELKRITKTLPSLFESLKFVIGSHYMTFPVVYVYKGRRVITQCSILLDWRSSPKRILTKTKIISD
tara:strand:+ start:3658 stop:4461 length:804 start_codon:yes stop_codon:yes gene_type:complete